MASPYVYLGGRLRAEGGATLGRRPGGRLDLDRQRPELRAALVRRRPGTAEAVVDLTGKILRRYAYWLKVEITSATPGGAGLESLAVENDIQHAPRTLPWLGRGRNTITVAADGDPGVATRSVACRITPDASFTKNETTGTMGVAFDNLDVKDGACWWKGGVGRMTVPIEVPGDLVALRCSAQVRARGAKDAVAMLVSTDDGRTWREAARIAGPTPGTTGQFRFDDWPAGTRKALLRFEMTGNNTIGVLSFRVDADYRDPLAAGGVPAVPGRPPLDGGGPREERTTRSSRRCPFTYTIDAAADPEMTSVTYEMEASR